MVTNVPPLRLDGLDAHALQFINQYFPPVCAFLVRHFPDEFPADQLLLPKSPGKPWQPFLELERRVTRADARFGDERARGRRSWENDYLLPLAAELDLPSLLAERFLSTCWSNGLFDRPVGKVKQRVRPPYEIIVPRVRSLLTEATSGQDGAATLRALTRLCRDEPAAQRILHGWVAVPGQVVSETRGLILACLSSGPLGVLRISQHPCVAALLRLERMRGSIADVTANPDVVIAVLRMDLIALQTTLQGIHPELWREHLLHEPPHSMARQRYQAQLKPQQRSRIIQALAERHECDADAADKLFTTFVTGGLPQLVDWRSGQTMHSTRTNLTHAQIAAAIAEHLSALDVAARELIRHRLEQLLVAIDEVGIAFPLLRLLHAHPSSSFRVRFGRRLWFGVPARLQHRQQRALSMQQRRRRRKARLKRIANPTKAFPKDPVDRLVTVFAERCDITEATARSLLRNLITYGPIGMLPVDAWWDVIEPYLADTLRFAKLSSPDGTVNWDVLLSLLAQGATVPGGPHQSVSRNLALVLFNRFPKPQRWHGGSGEAVAKYRQRSTLVLKSVPYLHETWSVHPVQIPIPLKDQRGQSLSDSCFAAVVVEQASSLPMSCWVSQHKPAAAELGLALYEAIWHPGTVAGLPDWVMPDRVAQINDVDNWPLHGNPEHILVSDAIAIDDPSVERAAVGLMATIDRFHERPRSKHPIVEDLAYLTPAFVREVWGSARVTCEQAQLALLTWLRLQYFPTHRVARIPPELRDRGFAMPGHTLPAAGWLLPAGEPLSTIRNGVVEGTVLYRGPSFRVEPGMNVRVRRFPSFYRGMEAGLFVERDIAGRPHVEYLRRDDKLIDG